MNNTKNLIKYYYNIISISKSCNKDAKLINQIKKELFEELKKIKK